MDDSRFPYEDDVIPKDFKQWICEFTSPKLAEGVLSWVYIAVADPGGRGGGSKGSKDTPSARPAMNKLTYEYLITRLTSWKTKRLVNWLAFDPKCVWVCVCVGGGGSKAKALQACLISITAARWNGAIKK